MGRPAPRGVRAGLAGSPADGWKLDAESGRLVVVSVLDNLLKGAASQAVQGFNIACGFDERAGLLA